MVRKSVPVANCEAALQLSHRLKRHRKTNSKCPTLPEIWYVGSKSELNMPLWNTRLRRESHPKPSFLPHARFFYDEADIIYRRPGCLSTTKGRCCSLCCTSSQVIDVADSERCQIRACHTRRGRLLEFLQDYVLGSLRIPM